MTETQAHTQYDDFTGTAAADHADFENLGTLLGLPDEEWIILGFRTHADHPSIGMEGKSAADSSYTSMTVWAIRAEELTAGAGLEAYLNARDRVDVTEFDFRMGMTDYVEVEPSGFGVLLRASKRLSIMLWLSVVQAWGLSDDRINVAAEETHFWSNGQWSVAID